VSTAVNVQIVRPQKSGTESAGALLGYIAGYMLNGWLLMYVAATVTPWHLGYWHSVLVVLLVRSLMADSSFYVWTRRQSK
jgi:hypothetical protein